MKVFHNWLIYCSISIVLIFINTNSVYSQTLDDKIDELISKMTLEEKVKQLHQEGSFNTADNKRLKIPGFKMADGPHGVRNGFATSFPVGSGIAATWDSELIYRVGVALGKEFHGKGIHQALGPCLDLTLDPRNGRSPETTSEDPFLNGKINTSMVQGIQSTPVLATIKHFYTEYRQVGRTTNNYTLSQRNLLEHHGLQFREAIQIGGAFSVMNSYNLINNFKAAESSTLLTTDLRKKWGFPFYVVSDWVSINSAEKAIKAGCEIEMGSILYQDANSGLLALVNKGIVDTTVINEAVRRVLRTKFLSGMIGHYPQGNPLDVNSFAHQSLALEAGKKGLVLLKNDGKILPLNKSLIKKIAVIGPNAAVMQTDGSGSSWVDPFYKISPKEGIEKYIDPKNVLYAKGCEISGTVFSSDVNQAIAYASEADVVIFFGGLDPSQEGEGFDRANNSIELPGKQRDLIKLITAVNKNLIVVLISGGICTATPFINDIKGLIYGFYPGQEGGNAIAQVIFGDYNPSGKLPVTMPKNDSQLPNRNSNNLDELFGGGYRWFDKNNHIPQYAFGYGLSYTSFEFSNFSTSHSNWFFAEEIVKISVDVTNTGSVAGEEVVQLYIGASTGFVSRNVKDLKGFKKVYLEPGETKKVTFEIGPNELYYYSSQKQSHELDPGTYTFFVGNSSDNLIYSKKLDLRPHPPLPDLQIANIYTVPRYPLEGEKVIFLATVINYGTGPSPNAIFHEVSFKVNGKTVSRSFISADSIPKAGMVLLNGNIGGIDNANNYWVAESPGTYTIEAIVDEVSAIQETIENNNSKSVQLQVYNNPAQNLAFEKAVKTSSIESFDYIAQNAVDGEYNTRWSSKFTDPQYLTVDLGSIQKFNQIRITWETAYGKEYIIEVSDDEVNWRQIVNQSNGFGNIELWKVNGEGRYIKLTGTKRATEYGYSIYEFEVFYDLTTDIREDDQSVILDYKLEQNYPNPFNPVTIIKYSIPSGNKNEPGVVSLKIFDVLGREVAILVNENKAPGVYEVQFDGSNFSSGVYFYRLQYGRNAQVKKLVLMK
ncbi:MAG: glycoside hydrolase family 3 C-terminal domain-containing protein [Melioribacteraceae bacterium]|nr:glycoside hydrolase family 3 C-terminal domain-containing protein [Melioribacteraceae bacterium]